MKYNFYMNIRVLTTMMVLSLGLNALADSDKVCDDLYRLTCAPGTYDDGTGSAASGDGQVRFHKNNGNGNSWATYTIMALANAR